MNNRIQFVHDSDVNADCDIQLYAHCSKCLDELRAGKSPTDSPMTYARLNVGQTAHGLQIWCVRHDCNVDHIGVKLSDPRELN